MGITGEIAKQFFKTAWGSVTGFFSSYGKVMLKAAAVLTAFWIGMKILHYIQEAEEAKGERDSYRQALISSWAQTRKESLAVKKCTEVNLENWEKAKASEKAAKEANEAAFRIDRNADKAIEDINREAEKFLQGDKSCKSITPEWIRSVVEWMRERP